MSLEVAAIKILVIDDELIDQKTIKRAINKSGIIAEIHIADDGKKAHQLIEQIEFELIFVDYLLPDKNGIDLVREFTDLGLKCPMIIVTSQTDPELASAAIEAGATNYLTKSLISPEGVSLIIRNSLSIFSIQQQLEEAKLLADKNSRIKQDFLANMSHEIRTPMNAIIGYARLLLDSKLTPQQADYLQTVYSSSENLLMIINDILDFSKIESGKLNMEKISFNLRSTINEVVKVLKNSAEMKGLELIADYPSNAETFFVGDPYRLNQMLINLVNNAIKFTAHGSVKIIVEVKELKNDLFELKIHVKDTGIGIPEKAQKSLFDSFTQVESSTTRQYGGTGLGLSIVKQLATLMKGEVSIKSSEGKGSEFSIHLKLPKGASSKQLESSSSSLKELVQKVDCSSKKVLLVDDNEINRNLARIHFGKFGCQAEYAVNGMEALEMAIKKNYDVIFMDIQMPKMDGIEATKLILKEKPDSLIIGMSAHVLQEEIDRCFSIGMKDYLTKPYKQADLLNLCLKFFGEVSTIKSDTKPVKVTEFEQENVPQIIEENDLDLTTFKKEVSDDPDLITEILQAFLTNFDEFIENYKKHLKDKSIRGIIEITHKIAPGISMIGNSSLYQKMKDIETKALKEESIAPLLHDLSDAKQELQLYAESIKKYLKK